MRYKSIYTVLSILLLVTGSCKKRNSASASDNCFPGAQTVRAVLNAEATIQLLNGEYFIIEKNTIDTRLHPCSLDQEFKIDKLLVRITGEVKSTSQSGACCTENFVILKISK